MAKPICVRVQPNCRSSATAHTAMDWENGMLAITVTKLLMGTSHQP
ncbi:MAG: hypothetical protein QGI95_01175 [Dehalococcoidales bacterium]|nr:hypothetical protein [Dehalococcoidales bacterium]